MWHFFLFPFFFFPSRYLVPVWFGTSMGTTQTMGTDTIFYDQLYSPLLSYIYLATANVC